MKKRILALLLAVIMVFGVVSLVACDDDESANNPDDTTTSADQQNNSDPPEKLSAKEVFFLSLTNAVKDAEGGFAPGAAIPEISTYTGKFILDVNKLVLGQEDYTQDGKLAFEMDFNADCKNALLAYGISAEMFGEKPSVAVILDSEHLFVTDALGLFDKAVDLSSALDEDTAAMFGQLEKILDSMADPNMFATLPGDLLTAMKGALDDSCFAMEKKTVSVEGKEFADAYVVTFRADEKVLKEALVACMQALAENQDFLSYLSLFGAELPDMQELIDSIQQDENDEAFSLTMESVLSSEGECVRLNINVMGDGETDSVFFTMADNGDLATLRFGMDDQNCLNCIYTPNKQDNSYVCNATFLADGATVFTVNVTGKEEQDANTGHFTLKVEESDVSLDADYRITATDTSFKAEITAVTVNVGGTVSVKLGDISFGVAMLSETKIQETLSLDIDLAMYGIVIDADLSCEYDINQPVEITLPTDCYTADDLSQMDPNELLASLMAKYPKLVQLISDIYDSYAPTETDPDLDMIPSGDGIVEVA